LTATADLFSLAGRVALVTGASGALGGAFARILHGAGATVLLAARREASIRALARELGTRADAIAMDVADEASIAAGFAAAAERHGVCDVLVNNAGVASTQRFLEQSAAEWDAVMQVNLRGAFLVAQEAARRMVAAERPGSIVNIGSITGARTMTGLTAYASAKAALAHLTRGMAVELARHAIRVNAIAPGYIETEMNAAFFASDPGQAMIRRIPQRRLGRVEDLAGPLLLLASDAGAHMTGAVLTVDGGHSVGPL
jgi:NAD(P)-dependent dehydrogenase (short-subunit alcohol dehydrogenase family)